jgi:hypothetical protein
MAPTPELIDPSGCIVIRKLLESQQQHARLFAKFFDQEGKCTGICGGLVEKVISSAVHADGAAAQASKKQKRWGNAIGGSELSDPSQPQVLIKGCSVEPFHIEDEVVVPMGPQCGLHGQWNLTLSDQDMLVQEFLLPAMKKAVCSLEKEMPNKQFHELERLLEAYQPDNVAVSWENLGDRVISLNKTLCGWSFEPDLTISGANRVKVWSTAGTYIGDGTPKIFVNLGAKTVKWAFKYDKSDRDKDALLLDLVPGDAILMWGEARSWCSACVGIVPALEDTIGKDAPFDFCYLKFQDHRRLLKENPDVYKKCHDKSGVLDASSAGTRSVNKWFQYRYESMGGRRAKISNVGKLQFAAENNANRPVSSEVRNSARPSEATSRSESFCNELDDLIAKLAVHLGDDSLIKGWEAEKRIFKNGKDRGPLRAAARVIRDKAVRANVRMEESGRTGSKSQPVARSQKGKDRVMTPDDRAF